MQKTLYNALRTKSGQTVTASAALANVQKDVDTTLRRDLEEARAKLAELTTKSAEVTGPTPASLERAEIRKELAELRKLLADERKKKKAESAPPPEVSCVLPRNERTSAKQAPQPPKPAAEARVYQMRSFMSTSQW
jgi:ribosomal protein L29